MASTKNKTTNSNAQSTRERIEKEAIAIFSEKGYDSRARKTSVIPLYVQDWRSSVKGYRTSATVMELMYLSILCGWCGSISISAEVILNSCASSMH